MNELSILELKKVKAGSKAGIISAIGFILMALAAM